MTPRLRVQTKPKFMSLPEGKNTVKSSFCSAMQKTSMGDGNASKVVFVSGSKSTNSVSENRPRMTAWFTIVVAVVLFLGVVVLTAVFMRKTKEKTNSSRSVTEVNLEEGEILMYRVEQKLEIRGGDVQKGIEIEKTLL